jgi:hypothetical protein
VDTRELNDGPEVFTDLRAWMAQLVVLKDQGHLPNVSFGDDDDSRRFVKNVRHLNRGWKLGQTAKVPTTPIVRALAPRRSSSRERRPSVSRRVARSSVGSRGDPPPGESDPEPLAPWRGLVTASIRMHAHVLRRAATERVT